ASVLAAAIASTLVFLSVAIYVLPTLVAIRRHDQHAFDIAVLDIFVGWTIVGWAAALIWSLIDSTNSKRNSAMPFAKAPPLADVGLKTAEDTDAMEEARRARAIE